MLTRGALELQRKHDNACVKNEKKMRTPLKSKLDSSSTPQPAAHSERQRTGGCKFYFQLVTASAKVDES